MPFILYLLESLIMSMPYQANLFIRIGLQNLSEEDRVALDNVLFDHSGQEFIQFTEARSVDFNVWEMNIPIDWNVPVMFDEDEFLNDIHGVSDLIVGVIAISPLSGVGTFSYERSNRTNEHWTRKILADYTKDVISGVLGSVDAVVPGDMLPTVTFK